jgi:hypothetical protein
VPVQQSLMHLQMAFKNFFAKRTGDLARIFSFFFMYNKCNHNRYKKRENSVGRYDAQIGQTAFRCCD